jgi:hypothetical protein
MTKKEDQTPNAPEEKEGQSGGVAVMEKPKQFEDDDLVCVLYGWPHAGPGTRQFVDKTLFIEGVARNVPYAIVKHWLKGTRPDGKYEQVYGKVKIQAVLSNDATERDFCEATGITPMPADKFAAMLTGIDLDALAAQLGVEKLKTLIAGLEKHLPDGRK